TADGELLPFSPITVLRSMAVASFRRSHPEFQFRPATCLAYSAIGRATRACGSVDITARRLTSIHYLCDSHSLLAPIPCCSREEKGNLDPESSPPHSPRRNG